MSLSRRQFLARGAMVSASASLAGLFATSGPAGAFPIGGYGPLVPDPNGVVDLPAGFTYKVLATRTAVGPYAATQLGLRSPAENLGLAPGSSDGMASFYDPATQRTYIVLNHEISSGGASGVPKTFRGNPVPTWDAGSGPSGGCTTIVCDANMDVIEHIPALSGCIRNCSGGPTPWGTWLTCEEDTSSISGTTRLKNHGYLFEVDPIHGLTNGVAYNAMGRANHEAVAIDPSNSTAYITEDASGGLVYKFVPTDTSQQFGSLGNGGTLYAMKVPGYNDFGALSTALAIGASVSGVTWVQAANPDVPSLNASFTPSTVVTRGTKLEGCFFADGVLWFAQSYSSGSNDGAVFKYDPTTSTITLVTKIPPGGTTVTLTDGVTTQNHLLLDPDNLFATPYGGAVWSQDGGTNQYVVCLSPDGSFFPIAKNPTGGEWAGAHFSPDGTWLFANQQSRSMTLAITGPWVAAPPAEIPEVPKSVLLPVTGAAVATAGLLMFRGRRMN
ncbi:MAG: DUF839 domain-containing protein, partial [Actinobacteria bacterium]|nr:DUF839 domain-containing protein [Actinomycetota bacterium]